MKLTFNRKFVLDATNAALTAVKAKRKSVADQVVDAEFALHTITFLSLIRLKKPKLKHESREAAHAFLKTLPHSDPRVSRFYNTHKNQFDFLACLKTFIENSFSDGSDTIVIALKDYKFLCYDGGGDLILKNPDNWK